MLGASEAGDVAADLHQFSGRCNKENTLGFLTAFAAAEEFTPYCPPIAHRTLGHSEAFTGMRSLEWIDGSSQSSTASPLMGILKSPELFHKLIHHPKILHPAPAFALQSKGRKIPPPTTPALNGKVPSPMFTAALSKCLLLSCFSLNTCLGFLVWVKHELTGSYVITLPAQHILLLIVMQSIIFTCY